jgi:hypothetical protein
MFLFPSSLDIEMTEVMNASDGEVNEAAEQIRVADEKGLTLAFRNSDTYRKMLADVHALDRGLTEFEADTIIWWYISRPDMFTCEEGKLMMAGLEERLKKEKMVHDVEEEDDDEGDEDDLAGPATSVPTDGLAATFGGLDPIRELPGLDTPRASDRNTTASGATGGDAAVATCSLV